MNVAHECSLLFPSPPSFSSLSPPPLQRAQVTSTSQYMAPSLPMSGWFWNLYDEVRPAQGDICAKPQVSVVDAETGVCGAVFADGVYQLNLCPAGFFCWTDTPDQPSSVGSCVPAGQLGEPCGSDYECDHSQWPSMVRCGGAEGGKGGARSNGERKSSPLKLMLLLCCFFCYINLCRFLLDISIA